MKQRAMAIGIRCPECKQSLQFRNQPDGRHVKCPCGHTFANPLRQVPSTEIACPMCGEPIEVDRKDIGKQVYCPYCDTPLEADKSDFAAKDAVFLQASQDVQEKIRELRNEGKALAKGQLKNGAGVAWEASWHVFLIVGGLFLLLRWFGAIPPKTSLWLAVGAGAAAAVVVGLAVFLVRFPWYTLSPTTMVHAAEKDRSQKQDVEKRHKEEEEAGHRAEEERRLGLEAEEAEKRKREEEYQRLLVDGGCEECWRELGWWDFEIAILMVFEHRGFTAQATEPSRDGGLDGLLTDEGTRYGVQAKHFGSSDFVGVAEIRDFIGAMVVKDIGSGFFVTTGNYSSDATQLAEESAKSRVKVTLLSIEDLTEWGAGLEITPDAISEAKNRWGVPQDTPPGMAQGRRPRRKYRRWHRW